MRLGFVVASVFLIFAGYAAARADDRPPTEEERAKLSTAMQAEGCSGGTMEVDDDDSFEVDNARCGDGRTYDLEFDKSFKLIEKDRED